MPRAALPLPVALALAASACGPGAEISALTPLDSMAVGAWVSARVSGAARAWAVATAADGAEVRSWDQEVLGNELTLALLGLAPDTDYEVVLHVQSSGSAAAQSKPMSFRSGSLPAGFPGVAAQGEAGGSDLTLLGVVSRGGSTHAAMAVDGAGRVVWYHVTGLPVTDVTRQPGDGLYSACETDFSASPPVARYDVFDRAGRLLRTWSAPAGSTATDFHELRLTLDGDALLMGSDVKPADFSGAGGPSGAMAAGDTLYRLGPSGEVRFQWSAFDHLSFDDVDPAVRLSVDAVDWTHGDAIDVTQDGHYLVTFRNLDQVVKIDSQTGAVLWRLGGRRTDFAFADDPLGGPSFPHGARELPDGHVLLFDNGNGRFPQQSRAVEYALDAARGEARIAWQYAPPSPLFAPDLGFAQRLPGGNTLVTYGSLGRVEEVTPSGQVVWSLRSTDGFAIDRAVRIDSLY